MVPLKCNLSVRYGQPPAVRRRPAESLPLAAATEGAQPAVYFVHGDCGGSEILSSIIRDFANSRLCLVWEQLSGPLRGKLACVRARTRTGDTCYVEQPLVSEGAVHPSCTRTADRAKSGRESGSAYPSVARG